MLPILTTPLRVHAADPRKLRTQAMHSPLDLPGTRSATAAQRSPGGSERVDLSARSNSRCVPGGHAGSSMCTVVSRSTSTALSLWGGCYATTRRAARPLVTRADNVTSIYLRATRIRPRTRIIARALSSLQLHWCLILIHINTHEHLALEAIAVTNIHRRRRPDWRDRRCRSRRLDAALGVGAHPHARGGRPR